MDEEKRTSRQSEKTSTSPNGFSRQNEPSADSQPETAARQRRSRLVIGIAGVLVLALACALLLHSAAKRTVPSAAWAAEPDETIAYDGTALDDQYLEAMRSFAANGGKSLLNGEKTTAYSPAALYTALSMVSELADKSSRDSLLKALEVSDIHELQNNSARLWQYLCSNPDLKAPGEMMIANSLWLSQDYTFRTDVLQKLADQYYVSSYTGDMENDIPEMVSDWVKKQSHDLLECSVEPDADTMAILLSAIYFYDDWDERFSESLTTQGEFMTNPKDPDSSLVPCNYMHRMQDEWDSYQEDGVTASVQYFSNGGKMLFVLPDEKSIPTDLLNNTELMARLLNWENLDKKTGPVEWSIPRFTLKETLNLKDGLSAMGLEELFDEHGNPLPLLSGDQTPAYIGHAEQGTAISIDENGCEAASYVEIEAMDGAAMLPGDLVEMYLNRPFVFAILSENDVPLFLGVINNPNS